MAVEFKLDNLGDDVESGDVLEIMVAVGDTIELEQGVIELETDKATMVVPSEFAGTVTKICCAEGDTLKPGDVLMEIESSGAAAPAPAPEPTAPAAEPTPPPAAPTPVAAAPTPPAPAPVTPTPAPVAATPAPAAKPVAPVVSTVPDGGQIAAGPRFDGLLVKSVSILVRYPARAATDGSSAKTYYESCVKEVLVAQRVSVLPQRFLPEVRPTVSVRYGLKRCQRSGRRSPARCTNRGRLAHG